ncbi:MAG TPA: lamin tail domain-containing protein, partial [Cytophaga sp.]|nr:lamin tail domain-containing protein [Cytophaga sp.]
VDGAYKYGTSYTCYLNQVLEEGNAYNFRIDSIRTCRNQLKRIDAEIEIIYPKQIKKNEVFINEILYNPNSGGVDFIELYNSTSKYIELQSSHFYNQSNTALQHVMLSDNKTIQPFGFTILTSDTAILKRQYNNTVTTNAFQIARFLSLPDTGGKLIWLSQDGDTLDQVSYGDSYQNPLHRNTEGYSLEKISSIEPIFHAANWTTSAVSATPGYINSQHTQAYSIQQKPFYCNPCHVTTDLNGVNDYVIVHMNETAQGCFGSIGIYRLSGEKVIDLIVNQPLGNTNAFQWNGQKQGGGLLEDGIYIAVAEWWSSDGKTYVSKIAISTSQY